MINHHQQSGGRQLSPSSQVLDFVLQFCDASKKLQFHDDMLLFRMNFQAICMSSEFSELFYRMHENIFRKLFNIQVNIQVNKNMNDL